MEMRGGTTLGHSCRVADLARKLEAKLGVEGKAQLGIFFAALHHDIGKIGFSDFLLRRPVSRMNGLEMSQAFKAEDSDAQIVVITSDKDSESIRHALAIGVERYISKPVDMHLLVDAISKCVHDRQQNEELRLIRQVAELTKTLQEQLEEKKLAEEELKRERAEQRVLIDRLRQFQSRRATTHHQPAGPANS